MIYLDYASTTPMCEEALSAYVEYSRTSFGNANSSHAYGRSSSRILEAQRKKCLKLLKLEKTHNLIFTSGASESNSMALKAVALRYQNRGKRIISCSAEHPSVLKALEQLRDEFGFDVIFLPASKDGAIDIEELKKYVDKSTILVSAMAVNNETGAVSPIEEIAAYLKGFPKCYFHVDATQAFGKENIDYTNVDLISSSAHKFEGPKGVGMLFFRSSISFLPLISGGEQEFSMRGGTVNVPGIVAATVALEQSFERSKKRPEIVALSNKIKEFVANNPANLVLNSPNNASPFIVNFSFLRHKASVVLEALSEKGIYLSSVSACSSKGEPISHVLTSMGLEEERARNSMRVSFSSLSSLADVDTFLDELDTIMKEVHTR